MFDLEPWDTILDISSAVLLVVGAALSLAAAVGLIRFPDALARLHAATKPQILGLILIVIALALSVRSWAALLLLLPVIVFQMLTSPISAHMVGRSGYHTGAYDPDGLVADELAPDIEEASRSSVVSSDDDED